MSIFISTTPGLESNNFSDNESNRNEEESE